MSQYQMDTVKSDRVFYRPMGWYFATREGVDMGPFPSRKAAEAEITYYLESMQKLSKKTNAAQAQSESVASQPGHAQATDSKPHLKDVSKGVTSNTIKKAG